MTVKDVIYVALIVLSGLIFYLYGIDAGVRRTRRLFQQYLKSPKTFSEIPQQIRAVRSNMRRRPHAPAPEPHGLFGQN